MPFFPPSGGGASLGPGSSNAAPGTIMANNVTLYASPYGSDANDGLSWQYAFKTYDKLVQTSNSLGGCTAYALAGTWTTATQAGGNTGPGLWLRGSYDLGAGGAGWLNVTSSFSLNIVPDSNNQFGYPSGVISPGGGAATFNGPVLQMCGIQELVEITGLNADIGSTAYPAFRLGLSSTLRVYSPGTTYASGDCVTYSGISYQSLVNGNVGNQPDTHTGQWGRLRIGIDDGLAQSLTAGFALRRCQFNRTGAGVFPTVDAGYAFFGEWENVVISRNGTSDPAASTSAGLRMFCDIGSNVASYNQTFSGVTLNGGGFWSIGNNNTITIRDVFGENMVTPSFYAESNASGGTSADLNNVLQGDSSQLYTIDVSNNSAGVITASGPIGESKGRVYFTNQSVPSNQNTGLARSQYGTVSGLSLMQHDSARRQQGPVACPYANIASPASAYGGVAHPGHAGLANGSYRQGGYIFRNTANATLAAGDRLVFGAGIRFVASDPNSSGIVVSNSGGSGSQTVLMGGPGPYGGQQVTLAPGETASWFPQWPMSRYEWKFIFGWLKVISLAGEVALNVECQTGTSCDLENFWCCVIPAADDRSDSEVGALAMLGGPTPNNIVAGTQYSPTAGMPALFPGQKLAFWDDTSNTWKYVSVVAGIVTVS